MLLNIAIGCALLVVSTFIHALVMTIALRGLKITRPDHWIGKSHTAKATAVAGVVLIMFVASVIESVTWAATYLALGAMSDPEEAVYFSTVTYTTLGFGDVVMEGRWRLLSAFEAAAGIIMFGWTTAVIVSALQRLFTTEPTPR